MKDSSTFLNHLFSHHLMAPSVLLGALKDGVVRFPEHYFHDEQGNKTLADFVYAIASKSKGTSQYSRTEQLALDQVLDRMLALHANPWGEKHGFKAWEYALQAGWAHACERFLAHPKAPSYSQLANGVNHQGFQWMGLACQENIVEVVAKLASSMSDINQKDPHGNAVIHYARSNEVLEVLLQNNASLTLKNNLNELPLDIWKKALLHNPRELAKMRARMSLPQNRGENTLQDTLSTVIDGGYNLLFRDGGGMLKRAGWPDPRIAHDAQGHTVFYHRAFELLRKELQPQGGWMRPSEYISNASKILPWLPPLAQRSELDQGLAFAVLAVAYRLSQGSGLPKLLEMAKKYQIEIANPTTQDFSQMAQAFFHLGQQGLENTSLMAAYALGGALRIGARPIELLRPYQERYPLLDLLEASLKGLNDPAWNGHSNSKSPDLALGELWERMKDALSHAPMEFWQHPDWPALFIKTLPSELMKQTLYSDTPLRNLIINSKVVSIPQSTYEKIAWCEECLARMNPNAVVQALREDPHAKDVLTWLSPAAPSLEAILQSRELDATTPTSSLQRPRRSL